MYAIKIDLDNYKWACNSTAESRNQYPSEQAFYENKLLGIVAGWMDNRVPISNTTYMDVKSIMRQSHTFKWVVTVDNIYGIRVAKYWLP
jgi:alpha-acetolactate decarboxylase